MPRWSLSFGRKMAGRKMGQFPTEKRRLMNPANFPAGFFPRHPLYSLTAMTRFFLSTLVTIILAISAVGQNVEIRQRYKDAFRYTQQVTITQESSVSTGVTDSTTKSHTSLELESTAATNKSKGKGMLVALRYKKAVMSVETNGKKYHYDSTTPDVTESAGFLQSIGGVIDRGFDLTLDENGHLETVTEADATVARLATQNRMVSTPYRDMFTVEAIKRMMDQTMIRSPRGVILKPGDSWPLVQEIPLPGLGKLNVTGTYKLVGNADFEGKQCLEIAVEASITQQALEATKVDLQDNDEFGSLSRQMKLKLDGSMMTGTIYFDPAISFPRALSMTQLVNITAKIPDGTANVIKMPIKQTISVKLSEMTDVHSQ